MQECVYPLHGKNQSFKLALELFGSFVRPDNRGSLDSTINLQRDIGTSL